MKAILKFDLPEDATEFYSAVSGSDAIALLTELDGHLLFKAKRTDNEPSATVAAYEAIRQELTRLLDEYEVSLY